VAHFMKDVFERFLSQQGPAVSALLYLVITAVCAAVVWWIFSFLKKAGHYTIFLYYGSCQRSLPKRRDRNSLSKAGHIYQGAKTGNRAVRGLIEGVLPLSRLIL